MTLKQTSVFVLFAALICCVGFTEAASIKDVRISLVSPTRGVTVHPGQVVRISWDARIPKGLDCSWCEQELFLSLDGGRSIARRITMQLAPGVRSFNWTVPNLPTNEAVIVNNFGIDGFRGAETRHPQMRNLFRILPADAAFQGVEMRAPQGRPAPGSEVRLNWNSSVKDVAAYQVLVSFNRGAHFHTLGRTSDKHFIWKVPGDFSGGATFKIVAHRNDGATFESSVAARPDFFVN